MQNRIVFHMEIVVNTLSKCRFLYVDIFKLDTCFILLDYIFRIWINSILIILQYYNTLTDD